MDDEELRRSEEPSDVCSLESARERCKRRRCRWSTSRRRSSTAARSIARASCAPCSAPTGNPSQPFRRDHPPRPRDARGALVRARGMAKVTDPAVPRTAWPSRACRSPEKPEPSKPRAGADRTRRGLSAGLRATSQTGDRRVRGSQRRIRSQRRRADRARHSGPLLQPEALARGSGASSAVTAARRCARAPGFACT